MVAAVPGMPFKLGRLPARHDARTFKLATLLAPSFPDPPKEILWSRKLKMPPGMFANDQLGCCTCTAAAHALKLWTSNVKTVASVTDADVRKAYWGTGNADTGRVMLDVLNYLRKFGIAGHKIAAFVQVDTRDPREMDICTYWFGGVYLGIDLTAQGMNQFDAGEPWSQPRRFWRSIGGHCVFVPDKRKDGTRTCLSWNRAQGITPGFMATAAPEGYAILTRDWVDDLTSLAPNLFDFERLKSYLGKLAA